MSEIEVIKIMQVWKFQTIGLSPIVGLFSSENELLEVLKPYNISKDDFDYIDIIGDDDECDQPLGCILEEDDGDGITTYLVRETYALNQFLNGYKEEIEDLIKGKRNNDV